MNFTTPENINVDDSKQHEALGTKIATTSNNNRKVLLRVKRKRDEDPLTALIIQERVKEPKKSRVESNFNDDGEKLLKDTYGVSPLFKSEKITEQEEEKALLLFRRLGTVAADDVGITHKKASKLMRKFKEIEKRRNRSNLRRNKGVEDDISWYDNDKHGGSSKIYNDFDNGAGADGRKKRIAKNARNSRKKRSNLLNIRRKTNIDKRKDVIDERKKTKSNFNDTFDVMDVDPKKTLGNKETPAELVSEEATTTPIVPQDVMATDANAPKQLVFDANNKIATMGTKIMSPTDLIMDKAIFNSFREGPRFCDQIIDALNQGCNANFARYQADNTTALMAACLHGRGDIVLRLIKSGSDMTLLDNKNRSAVDFAKIGKNFDIVTELIQLGGLTGVEIIQMRKEAAEKSQYVYDYYYLKGVAPNSTNSDTNNKDSDGVKGGDESLTKTFHETYHTTNNDATGANTASAFSNSAILDITTKYQSKFLRATDSNNYINYINAEDLFSDATNARDSYFGIDEFQYENDAHNISELDDSNDSNAENYLGNEYPDSDPGILFTSEEEEDNQYHDDYDNERCMTMGDGEDYYY